MDGLSVGGDVTYQSELPTGYAARSVSYADRATLTPLRLSVVPENVTLDAYVSSYKTRHATSLLRQRPASMGHRLNYAQAWSNLELPASGRKMIFSLGATF